MKSVENVQRVQNLIENKYLNPFGLMDGFDKRILFHLSSGVPLKDEVADKILSTFCKGKVYTSYFRKKGSSPVKNYFMPHSERTILCHFRKSQQNTL